MTHTTGLLKQFIEYGEHDYRIRGLRRHTTVEKNRGRQERREYYAAPAQVHLKEAWRDIQTVGMVQGDCTITYFRPRTSSR